jgi:hypothetical protein
MFEYVYRCFLIQHLEHQIVESEWDTGGDAFEYCGIHAVDAHADEMRQFRLLAKFGHMSFCLFDHAEVHLRRPAGGRDSESRVISPVAAHQLTEVKIGKYSPLRTRNGASRCSRRSDSGPIVPSGSSSCVYVIRMFH